MRRIHFQPLALLALFLGLVGPARADQMGVTDSLAAANAESRYGGDGAGTVGFQLSGTWSATITFEATINGVTWTSVYAYNRASGTGATTATSNGTYVVSTAGVRYVRARVSAYTSGTVAVTGLLSPEQSVMDGGASGGGGAGDASAANQTSGDQLTQIVDSTGSKVGVTDHALQVNCANCSGSGVSATDSSTFTNASTAFATTGGFYQSTQTANPLASGRQGAAQVTRYRAVHVNMRDSSGAPMGTAATPVRTDPTGSTAQPVTDNGGSITVDNGGTFPTQAAQSGTWNLNNISGTISLPTGAATAANQSTGNTALSGIQTAAEIMDDWDETDRAKVNLIAGQAGIAGDTGSAGPNVTRVVLAKDQAVKLYATRASKWFYAPPTAGLTSTTAVKVKNGAAGLRACVTSVQVMTTHQTTSTEVVVFASPGAGASTDTLWRGWAQAAGGGAATPFPVDLCTPNTGDSLKVRELSATSTAGVLVNLQGYTTAE